jgi:hypothetical protein
VDPLCYHLRGGQIRASNGDVGDMSTAAAPPPGSAKSPRNLRYLTGCLQRSRACAAIVRGGLPKLRTTATEEVRVHGPAAWPFGARCLQSATVGR